MRYEPKVLVNRTGKTVEFMCGGRIFIHKKNEVINYDGVAANHALRKANTGLEEYTEEVREEMAHAGEKSMPEYDTWTWKRLVSELGQDFTPGMNKTDVILALEKRWKTKN
jgi:hypothetical protein